MEEVRPVSQRDRLVELNRRDLLSAFKLTDLRFPLNHFARFSAERFADELIDFDLRVGESGLKEGGRFILERFSASCRFEGMERVPKRGPLIVASNHPGMIDAMALWVGIAREDLMVIGADRDLLRLLPNTCNHLILIEKSGSSAFRQAEAHLKAGGALLTFPAGRIEPDVTVRDGACESLAGWSPSVGALKRRVPDTTLLPAFVRGVICGRALRNPLLRYLENQKDRDWAGATLQILFRAYRRVNARVEFGCPSDSFEGVVAQMRHFIHATESENSGYAKFRSARS